MCEFFEISRASYYAWVKRMAETDRDAERMGLVLTTWQNSRKTYGYRRVADWLAENKGIIINKKAVLRLMQKLHIRSIARKPNPYKRIGAMNRHHQYDNVLKRDFKADKPNQKWVTDITYVATNQGWAYLSTIKDLFDGFIVAHRLARHNSVRLVLNTIQQARRSQPDSQGVLIHSDQGHQYASRQYSNISQQYPFQPSMSRKGNCWDNAPMESFFSHLKEESLRHYKGLTYEEVESVIDDYIHFYNYERIQLKTKQTPYQIRCLSQ
jgi:transposase InsO family protein